MLSPPDVTGEATEDDEVVSENGIKFIFNQAQGPFAKSSPSPLQCSICHRQYERVDHLKRHVRSHENARPFKCTQCSKRFNRTDLLSRHALIHEKPETPPVSTGQTVGRAGSACNACVSSKTRCGNVKPCLRCLYKGIVCQMADRSGKTTGLGGSDLLLVPISDSGNGPSQSEQAMNSSVDKSDGRGLTSSTTAPRYIGDEEAAALYPGFTGNDLSHSGLDRTNTLPAEVGLPFENEVLNNITFFSNASAFMGPDVEFGFWDLPFEGIQSVNPYPYLEINPEHGAERQQSTSESVSHWNTARGYAAYKRSPWLWTPAQKDNSLNGQDGLVLIEENTPSSLTPSSPFGLIDHEIKIHLDVDSRDRMFGLATSAHRGEKTAAGFPKLQILNHLLQLYFVRENYQVDSWIHAATFEASESHPHLLTALVSAGSTLISHPAIWKMGLALQEVARVTIAEYWESNNKGTGDLELATAFLLCLEVGLWSGFKRKMEIAEGFAQPMVTMMRRRGTFASAQEAMLLFPDPHDFGETLVVKWKNWVKRESFKRFAIHLFLHCTKASISFQMSPVLLLSELTFSLPASRDLWLARSAIEWKEIFLSKNSPDEIRNLRIADFVYNISLLESFQEYVDVNLCCTALLYSFWGQIWSLRESSKFYNSGNCRGNASKGLWLTIQQSELDGDIENFFTQLTKLELHSCESQITKELQITLLYVSIEELEKFAGKGGEEEAVRTSDSLLLWVQTENARKAAWHAGQVLRAAKQFPPAELRGFYAVAVYLASLCLWVYGQLLNVSHSTHKIPQNSRSTNPYSPIDRSFEVLLDGPENRQTRTFLAVGQGVPGLLYSGAHGGESFASLEQSNVVFSISRQIYKRNFPMAEAMLPPLVENIVKLMRDLSSSHSGSRYSRCASEDEL